MWLIVGLGNPGTKYTFTRHNVGFLLIEHCLEILEEKGLSVSAPKSEHKSVTWKVRSADKELLFVEPQTFMNLSGQAVQSLMAYYKVPLENILVVQDDLDLAFGRIKFLKNRGHGGHNGIRNITEICGTSDYARLKIGVGAQRHPGQEGGDFVLENFSQEEAKNLSPIFDKCFESIQSFIEKGYERTANVYNQKTQEEKLEEKSAEKKLEDTKEKTKKEDK